MREKICTNYDPTKSKKHFKINQNACKMLSKFKISSSKRFDFVLGSPYHESEDDESEEDHDDGLEKTNNLSKYLCNFFVAIFNFRF